MTYCSKCGAPLAPDAQFCSRCGTPAPAAIPQTPPPAAIPQTSPPTSPPVPTGVERRNAKWWIIPLVVAGVLLLAWLLLAGLPFRREPARPAPPAVETIAEGTSTATPPSSNDASGTIVDVDQEPPRVIEETAPPATTTAVLAPNMGAPATTPPPTSTTPTTTTTTTTIAPSRTPSAPAARPSPAPAPTPVPAREIGEDEAAAELRGFITSRTYYDGVPPQCVQLRASGYRNVGYGFSVWDSCVSGGGSRMLGRWRVDAKTREVFVQRDDGRYLRP